MFPLVSSMTALVYYCKNFFATWVSSTLGCQCSTVDNFYSWIKINLHKNFLSIWNPYAIFTSTGWLNCQTKRNNIKPSALILFICLEITKHVLDICIPEVMSICQCLILKFQLHYISSGSGVLITNNVHEKIRCIWLAENKCIFHVTRAQSCKLSETTNSAHVLLKFRLSCLWCVFHVTCQVINCAILMGSSNSAVSTCEHHNALNIMLLTELNSCGHKWWCRWYYSCSSLIFLKFNKQ